MDTTVKTPPFCPSCGCETATEPPEILTECFVCGASLLPEPLPVAA